MVASQTAMTNSQELGISVLDYHVLLSLAEGPRYGYAIKDAVVADSLGAAHPRAGTLYRVLARLMAREWVTELTIPPETVRHPGRARRYYSLTAEGRRTLVNETQRLRRVAGLAEDRLAARSP